MRQEKKTRISYIPCEESSSSESSSDSSEPDKLSSPDELISGCMFLWLGLEPMAAMLPFRLGVLCGRPPEDPDGLIRVFLIGFVLDAGVDPDGIEDGLAVRAKGVVCRG